MRGIQVLMCTERMPFVPDLERGEGPHGGEDGSVICGAAQFRCHLHKDAIPKLEVKFFVSIIIGRQDIPAIEIMHTIEVPIPEEVERDWWRIC